MKIMLNRVQVAFLDIFEAVAVEGSDNPKFGIKLVIDPKNRAHIETLDAAILATAKEKWKEKAEAVLSKLTVLGKPKNIETCFVREPYPNRDGNPHEGFEGMYYVSATSPNRPLVIDRDKSPLRPSDGRPYGGSICNVQLEVWAQDNKWGKAVRAEIKAIQFVEDGPRFSGSAPANLDDFESLAVAHDGSDLV